MSNRKKPKNRRQNSRLKDHKRTGKILKPPMRTIGNMRATPWLRDGLPDMLWLCTVIKLYGDKPGMVLASEVLDRMDTVLGLEAGAGTEDPNRIILSGELTTFDKIAVKHRPAILDALQRDGLYERAFPLAFARALQRYDDPPAAWLLRERPGGEKKPVDGEPERFLREVMAVSSGGSN